MDFTDWVPSLTTAGVVAAALWLGRSLLITRLRNAVQHEFDAKLESLKTELRASEEQLKADLRRKDAQIEALRGGALSGLASRQSLLDKKRVEGIEKLWSAVVAMGPAEVALAWMATVKFEAAAKETATNPKFREIFEVIGGSIDLDKMKLAKASHVRPFVSDLSWAIFSAYQAIGIHAVSQLMMLKSGLGQPDFLNTEKVTSLVEAVLPHQAEYLSRAGANGYHYLVEELKTLLLAQLRHDLRGEDLDQDSLDRSARILREAEELMRATKKTEVADGNQ